MPRARTDAVKGRGDAIYDGLAVVVLVYGTAGEYLAVLRALSEQGVDPGQVLLVHNPSQPGERLPEAPAGSAVLSASHNLGYAAGMNLGIRRQLESGCKRLLLLTHDARLRPGALALLVDAARSHPDYGVLGPSLVLAGSDVPFSFGGTTGAGGGLEHRRERPASRDEVAACDWIDGGTMLVGADALAAVGGFDERLWSYCEDADLCLRLERAGFGVGVVVAAIAEQAPGGAKRPGPWAYLLARNGLAFAGRSKGARGIVAGLLRAAGLVVTELARTAARLTPLRPGSPVDTWAVAVGTLRGTVDFSRRRWGPPPPGLPGGSDMSNLAARRVPGRRPMPDAPRVLQIGPDVRGGMRTAMRGLFDSPLAQDYRLQFVVTHRGSGAMRRLAVYLWALARLTAWSLFGRGRIVHVHGTVRGSMYRKAACVLLAKALRRRVVFHTHSGPGDVATFTAGLNRVSAAFLRLAFRRADVVLAVSAGSAAALEDAFEVDGIVVVPNVVPAVPGEPGSDRRPERAGAVYLGGFANQVKGGTILLEALERPQAAGLPIVLAGPGELPERGRRLVDGPAPVEWRGWLDAVEKDSLLRAATVFVLPSTSEGLPMALLEAMAYGLAIAATEVGGVPEVVSADAEALLVPPGDPEALAVALGRLGADVATRERLGRAAQTRAEAFGPAAIAARLDEIYRELA